MQTFEEYLADIHAELYPELLDDDLPEAFDSWLGTLDGQDYIDYAEDWGNEITKHYENGNKTR